MVLVEAVVELCVMVAMQRKEGEGEEGEGTGRRREGKER
jgi:hypothetical protein